MSKQIIPQVYGYVVCLVTILTLLFSLQQLINNGFEYANPKLAATYNCAYINYPMPAIEPAIDGKDISYYPYKEESDKNCLEQTRYNAVKQLTNYSLLTVVSFVLFIVHWRWVGKQREEGK